MGGLLILISMAAGTVAFISLIRPLPRFWLPTRKRAAIAWVASFVLLFIGAALSPNPKPEELAMQETGNNGTGRGLSGTVKLTDLAPNQRLGHSLSC